MFRVVGYTREGKPFNYMEFQCDTEDDVKDLPHCANGGCAIGSKAFIESTKHTWNLGNDDEWKDIGESGSGGGGGGGGGIEIVRLI